jgi:hypothetical protein
MLYSKEDLNNAPTFDPKVIRRDVAQWLAALQSGLEPGRFAYCRKGSLVPTHGNQALMPTVFAMKIAWQTGVWKQWPAALRAAAIKRVTDAQRVDGTYVDAWTRRQNRPSWREWAKIALMRNRLSDVLSHYREWAPKIVRAETRQNISTLLMVEHMPQYAPPVELTGYNDTRRFLEGLDWSDPWGAGSHLSHQAMLSAVHQRLETKEVRHGEIVEAICEFLKEIYHDDSGTWYKGDGQDEVIKINGTMKVFSGLQWISHPFYDHKNLIDLILGQPFHSSGCHFTNSLFTLYNILKTQNGSYRLNEIKERARLASRYLMLHKKEGAGFSFNRSSAQQYYYTARTSKGFDEADIHGTVMYTWSCAMIIEILKEDYPDEANIWRAHVP